MRVDALDRERRREGHGGEGSLPTDIVPSPVHRLGSSRWRERKRKNVPQKPDIEFYTLNSGLGVPEANIERPRYQVYILGSACVSLQSTQCASKRFGALPLKYPAYGRARICLAFKAVSKADNGTGDPSGSFVPSGVF